jgi:molecular chaperone Hsp33
LLGVLLQNSEPFVTASGGVLVQMMPGANVHIITMIEDTIAHAPHLTSVIKEGATAEDLLRLALGDIAFEVLEENKISFKCNCSMEKAFEMIASLGKTEVEAMLAEDDGAVMTCGFCGEIYQLDSSDLQRMLQAE